MGDEGKNRKHKPRKHGYFIEPAAAKATPAIEVKEVPASQQKNDRQGAKKHKKNRQNQGKPANPEQKNQAHNQQRPEAHNQAHQMSADKSENASAAAAQSQSQSQNHNQNQNHKKKKNRHKSKPRPIAQPNAAGSESAEAQRPTSSLPKNRPAMRENRPLMEHNESDYEEYRFGEELSDSEPRSAQASDNAQKTEVVGIRFKSTGKIYYFDPVGKQYKKGMRAIVDTARGQEFGEVAMANSGVRSSDIVAPLRAVIREATASDIEHHDANVKKQEEAFKICSEKIAAHGLDMKLIDAQYTFDNSKLLFYFTSADRVDFRELVKDLAAVFRTRIELRQIGIRDEAKLMGGLGMCGRPLCCTLFLSDFDQVSIKMAKEQSLSLNSAKISGICGRLMCCLRYEHEAYEYEIKRTPPVDSLVRTENGDGIVTEISPLRGTLKVRLIASPETPPKVYHRDNVTMLRKKQNSENK